MVAAASKVQRPAGERVKTDARDAAHLARLLRLDEYTAVIVPDQETEAARDLVRTREDCRADLMGARHRVSKLLLRHGVVYSGGKAWTGAHLGWLEGQHFDLAATQTALDEGLTTSFPPSGAGTVSTSGSARSPPIHPGPRSSDAWGV